MPNPLGKKIFRGSNYNYVFDMDTGVFQRWGATVDDDPDWCPYGPELLDLEISTGSCKGKCKWCYKANGDPANDHHMSFDQFKIIFDKMPYVLTQIAFGITDTYANKDFFKMMEYSRNNGVVPNYTTHGLDVDQEAADRTAELCGAVAVSVVNKAKTFKAIELYKTAGMDQVNIHFVLSEESFDDAKRLAKEVSELDLGVRAIVFLQYKPKGRMNEQYHSILSVEKYKDLTQYCDELGVGYGFDSCSAPVFADAVVGHPYEKELLQLIEPCESGLFSAYINCHGVFFPCSFTENEKGWHDGIDVLHCISFTQDVWLHDRVKAWRKNLLENKRHCPTFCLYRNEMVNE